LDVQRHRHITKHSGEYIEKATSANMASIDEADSLEKILSTLPGLLNDRFNSLKEQEKELSRSIERLKEEKAAFGCGEKNDVIYLNVGGTVMATLRSTLTFVEDSMLASRFSGRWDDGLEKDRDGNFFIDQPIELFKPMIDHLRTRKCENPMTLYAEAPDLHFFDDNEYDYNAFKRMVEYYGVTPGVYPTEISMILEDSEDVSIEPHPINRVTANGHAIMCIKTLGHKRRIVSFEVTLIDVEILQIGWIHENDLNHVQNGSIGEQQSSVAIDINHRAFAFEGQFLKVDDMTVQKNSVIRCENYGETWIVDGKPIECTDGDSNVFVEVSERIPAFSGKGQWKVSKVELEP